MLEGSFDFKKKQKMAVTICAINSNHYRLYKKEFIRMNSYCISTKNGTLFKFRAKHSLTPRMKLLEAIKIVSYKTCSLASYDFTPKFE